MITVTKKVSFDSAHLLIDHPGKCKFLHGHTYVLEVTVTSKRLENGMVVDFGDLSKLIKSVVKQLDHHYLNRLDPKFWPNTTERSTAENLIIDIRNRLNTKIQEIQEKENPDFSIEIVRLRLFETPDSWVEWTKEGGSDDNE